MIENEYLDLPDDPEEAFATLQMRSYAKLEEIWENNQGGGGWYYERKYVDQLIAFDEVYGLGILYRHKVVPNSDSEFSDYFQDFRRHVGVTSQKILMEAARRTKSEITPIVLLDQAAREAIHHLIDRIREKLNEISLPEGKRDSLFNKLNAFASEIDRNRTRPEAFYAFAIEAARAAKTINEELKPLQQTIDKVFDWIEKAKKLRDSLPPWNERRKIEPPPKRLPAPENAENMEDDIPF